MRASRSSCATWLRRASGYRSLRLAIKANLDRASEPSRIGVRCGGMPTYLMTVVNEDFRAENEQDLPDAAEAAKQAIKGALAMGAEQVLAGKLFFGAEVIVSDGNNHQRFVVAVGASPIQ